MKQETSKKIDNVIQKVFEYFENIKQDPEFIGICEEMKNTGIAEHEHLSLALVVNLFDEKKGGTLDLYASGMQTNGGQYQKFEGGDTFEKFILNGEIEVVTNGKCPNCYNDWDFKLNSITCPTCSVSIGKEVKYLIDNDVCPSCDQGEVTRQNPKCDKCGYMVDQNTASWG